MDKIIDVNFDRVEKALTTLVNSIANYTSNPQSAVELVKADTDLVSGLKLLHTHQTNHTHLLALRAQSTRLDTQIRDTLSLLANTRGELLASPATVFPDKESGYKVEYHDLLAYARRISAFTLPPGGYIRDDVDAGGGNVGARGMEEMRETGTGLRTPPEGEVGVGAGAGVITGMGMVNSTENQGNTIMNGNVNPNGDVNQNTTTATMTTALTDQWHSYLNPHTDVYWVPWPHDEFIRRGGLANLTYLADSDSTVNTNMDMEGVETKNDITSTDNNIEKEKENVKEKKEEMARKEVERVRAAGTSSSDENEGSGQQVKQQQEKREPRVFNLNMLDDD